MSDRILDKMIIQQAYARATMHHRQTSVTVAESIKVGLRQAAHELSEMQNPKRLLASLDILINRLIQAREQLRQRLEDQ